MLQVLTQVAPGSNSSFSRYPGKQPGNNLNVIPSPAETRNFTNPYLLPQEPNLPYLVPKNAHAHVLDRRIPETREHESIHEVESNGSRGSKVESEGSRGSRKSDMGTNTYNLTAPGNTL